MSKAVVIYWTSTGNTELMANTFANAIGVEAIQISEFDVSEIDEYTHIAFGCPACGEEELDDSEFGPIFETLLPQLNGKHIALFGSYGWGDGEYMRNWEAVVQQTGALLFEEGQLVLETPDSEFLESLEQFAHRFIA